MRSCAQSSALLRGAQPATCCAIATLFLTRYSNEDGDYLQDDPTENVRFRGLGFGSGLVQGHRSANECLQRLLVDLLALVEVDGTPCVPVKTGVEEARRILQRRPFRKGHLDDVLVSLACANNSIVLPHRNPSPLPLLDDFRI